MAGPAIRYWEFAKALSKSHEVTIITLNEPEDPPQDFKIISIKKTPWKTIFKNIDVIIAQYLPHNIALKAKKNGLKIIIDAYDPMPLENLEVFKNDPLKLRNQKNESIIQSFNFSFSIADSIICANQRQKDLWLGYLLSLKKITPELYDKNSSLKGTIDIVPFGLSSNPPKKNGEGLRQRFGLKENDKVLLWGGGIWNWFDPLTLIQAIKILSQKRSDIKLVFMGIKHPNDQIPEMKMTGQAINLARELDLLDKNVFFNYGWTPYQERQNFLLEADIGISTHSDHLETHYAFRTRILDYIWALLPIISTEGDSFSELIESHQLGKVVPYKNPEALVDAIESILDNCEFTEKIKENLLKIRPVFYWETIIKPIEEMIAIFDKQPKRKISFKDYECILSSCYIEKGLLNIIKHVCKRLLIKLNIHVA